jgi:hypothetical protein
MVDFRILGSLEADGERRIPLGRARQRAVLAVDIRALGPRLPDLSLDSPALGRRAHVRLLLPARYKVARH